jgi:anthranilate phosphoribosyltransferase
VFEAASLPVVATDAKLAQAWSLGRPAYMDISVLNAGLHQLLRMRWELGLRNPGHTIAKLLDPWAHTGDATSTGATLARLRVVNHTHPEYAHSLTQFLSDTQAHAMLMRGTEGEPVADARRQPRADVFIGGQVQAHLGLAPQEGVLHTLPELPSDCHAEATVAYMAQVMADDSPMPAAISAQAQALIRALAQLTATSSAPAR